MLTFCIFWSITFSSAAIGPLIFIALGWWSHNYVVFVLKELLEMLELLVPVVIQDLLERLEGPVQVEFKVLEDSLAFRVSKDQLVNKVSLVILVVLVSLVLVVTQE